MRTINWRASYAGMYYHVYELLTPLLTVCLCRAKQAEGENVPFHIYRKTTSTDARRKHLCKIHGDAWVQECRNKGIPITASSAMPAVEAYLRRHPDAGANTFFTAPLTSGPRPEFSQEAFVDAIMAFIVSDDQVSPQIL